MVITFTEKEKGKVKVTVEVEINENLMELIRKDIEGRLARKSKSNQEDEKGNKK